MAPPSASLEQNCSDYGSIRVDTQSESLNFSRDSLPRRQALGWIVCRQPDLQGVSEHHDDRFEDLPRAPGQEAQPERMAHGRPGTDQIEEALSKAA